MLSVLIPTYNYSALPLVEEIHQQCISAGIVFEIIVQDDGSTNSELVLANQEINTLENCEYKRNKQNLGRAKNINSLIQSAHYKWILLLDCDTFPKTKTFIQNYLQCITNSQPSISFGGITYSKNQPEPNEVLRWKYGRNREALRSSERQKKPFISLLTSNIFCSKKLFDLVTFNENITEYGYEDLVFAKQIEKNNIVVNHLENPVYHLNYETSDCFLEKTKKSLETLHYLEKNQIIDTKTTQLQMARNAVIRFGFESVFLWIFKKWEKKITQNLCSTNPNLTLFDLYKLGYFIRLKANF